MDYSLFNHLKYFPQYYVGLRLQSEESHIPLGFLTPYATDKAFEKRKTTVDSWAKTYSRLWDYKTKTYVDITPMSPLIIENISAGVFKLCEMKRRYTTNNVVWRIEDPRNFEVEISSDNLAFIIETTGICQSGIIPQNCIWARNKNNNFLVPAGTDLFDRLIKERENNE
jgi:hypothetical protein